jgi:hypothetical protein
MESISFWDVHGIIFIFFMFFFPRLTMLFSGIACAWSGFWFWCGWLLAPRITVAIMASMVYWPHNWILVILAWIWALCGESTEKNYTVKYTVRKSNGRVEKAVN